MHPCRVAAFRLTPSYSRPNYLRPLDAESISSDAWAWSAHHMRRMILFTTGETRKHSETINTGGTHHDICI